MSLTVKVMKAKPLKCLIARTILCGLPLLLPACQIPSLRVAEAPPVLPASFNGPAGFNALPDYSGATSPNPSPAAADATPLAAVVGGAAISGSGVETLPLGVPVQDNSFGSADPAAPPATENSCKLGVNEFYSDPQLLELIQQGLANNRELKMLDQEIQIAGNEILARRGAYLPFVSSGGSIGIEKPSRYTRDGVVEEELNILPDRRFPNPLPNYRGGFNFFWTPDLFGALHNAQFAAQLRYISTIERRNYFVTTLIADIAENYYELMALDRRIINLDDTIKLQQDSLKLAIARKEGARGTELAVQRFQAEVRKNQSEKLLVRQDIVEAENRINFAVNRFPQPVGRSTADFFNLNLSTLVTGSPAELLMNRPDIRQAERALEAAGLDVQIARTRFYPAVTITAGIGYEAFNPRYLFNTPEAVAYNLMGDLVAPLINKKAIQADYLSANATQLQTIYNYQRVVLNAFTQVVNQLSAAQNYKNSVEIRKQQLEALLASVDSATKLFQNARVEYIEVLFAQRDLLDARTDLIQTKRQQLTAVVNAYQALGGGDVLPPPPQVVPDTFQLFK